MKNFIALFFMRAGSNTNEPMSVFQFWNRIGGNLSLLDPVHHDSSTNVLIVYS
jgi:hypothetical protein